MTNARVPRSVGDDRRGISAPLVPEIDPNAVALAVDIGGTKMAAGLVTGRGVLVRSAQVPTEGVDAEDLFATLCALIDDVRAGADTAPMVCGVGCGGPMSAAAQTVSPINIPVWRGFPLSARLAAHTDLVTFVDNDAKALALAEGWVGAAVGVPDFVGMVVSTGVGGGIVLDGRLLDGAGGNAGHIGHVNVEPEGHPCGCGSHGCLEAEVSGTAIAAITGRPAEEASVDVRERTGRLVGRALASVSCLLDLQLAVVAGSVALGFGETFFAAAQAEIDKRARLDFARAMRVMPAGLGSEAPLVGAAAVGWRGLGAR